MLVLLIFFILILSSVLTVIYFTLPEGEMKASTDSLPRDLNKFFDEKFEKGDDDYNPYK